MPESLLRAGVGAAPWDLDRLARARHLADWMFDQFAWAARGAAVEVGAGVGTFSARLLAAGVESLLLVEANDACADALVGRFGVDPRVQVAREPLPDAPSLLEQPGSFDFALCQNVLEHVGEDERAVEVLAAALAPRGRLCVIVPAGPRLFGSLDRAYGHERRYTREALRTMLERAGLRVASLYPFNALGIPGWSSKNRLGATSLGGRSLAAYDALLPLWRPIEERLRPRWGLSLVAHAEHP
ncbi:MAG TPA: methyltransferase domain-containing protein [Gaiellaceae bacterium]|nr:methyltransferase domain-containing protein [Gaiellaceae bacterium]